jgi:RsmE family RNA methyltransferase
MNLLLATASEVRSDGTVRVSGRRARHLVEVLRCAPGQRIRMGLLNGARGTGQVVEVSAAGVTLRWEPGAPPPAPRLDLLLALPRPKAMKRLWAPLASLGVRRIVLVNAARVEKSYFETHWLNPAHYTPLLLEGLEQAGDTRLPEVLIRRRFRPFVEDEMDALFPAAGRFVAHPAETSAGGGGAGPAGPLAVGPEGGWTAYEIELLREHGFRKMDMGWRTLRSDVACIALLAIVRRERLRREEEACDGEEA